MSGRTGQVEAGWAALEHGEWQLAASCFDEALDAAGDDPDALEGRAWAAWWLNDADTLFPVREQAFQAWRAAGDPVAAARAAIWLGCDHNDFRGAHAVANGWYRRARRLLDDQPPSIEHAWLAFHEGAYAIELADDCATAKQRAADTIAIAQSLSCDDLVFLGLALEGLALVTEGAVEEGMHCLDEAGIAATSGEITERICRTWTLCYLIYACERVRDFDRTAQWCARMREIASRSGSQFALGVCRAHYGGVLVLHGEWEDAEQELQEASSTLAAVRPPAVIESVARLAELRRRQGRLEEASSLFAEARPHPLAVLGLASIALDRGEAEHACELADELVAATPPEAVTQLADAHQLLALAHARRGDTAAADRAATELETIVDRIGNRPLEAMAALARGAVALCEGDDLAARRLFASAVHLFGQSGLPYEAARARLELARTLERLGDDDLGRRERDTANAALDALQSWSGGPGAAPEGVGEGVSSGAAGAAVAGLTQREAEVLAALSEGLTDREIAARLTISAHTVHRHVSNILTKLGVSSRTAAAVYASQHGMR